MSKTLFQEDFRYNQDGIRLTNLTDQAVGKIFKEYVDNGFSPREIFTIMASVVSDHMCGSVLEHSYQLKGKGKPDGAKT